jgi:cytochrome bd ubiquinol oxidase subunit II
MNALDWPTVYAGFLLAGLILYAITGGADFGGGVWELFARGPRAVAQRALIDHAIAPVWEANHVWLIFVIVLLFTAFPTVFAAASISLHLPLLLMLIGITLRGAAFVFRHYGGGGDSARRWGRVFAIASAGTPLLLGMILGAVTRGVDSKATDLYATINDWTSPFSLLLGVLTLALFAHLAAVFLTNETDNLQLQDDFSRRAIVAGAVAILAGAACIVVADAPLTRFGHHLTHSWWSLPLGTVTTLSTAATFALLRRRHFALARYVASAQVAFVIIGWGAAQFPVLLAPNFTIHNAASPIATLQAVAPIVIGGSLILFPSLFWMMRTFKRKAS